MKQRGDKSRRRFLKESSILGLAVAFRPGTIGEAFVESKSKAEVQRTAGQGGNEQADKTAIRPFHVKVPETELTELRRRIKSTKWPERETVGINRKACSSRRCRN
jgi:hypothetical protein